MSNSEPTEFDLWLSETFAETGGFTALILLVAIGPVSVTPLASSYLHVIGDDFTWDAMRDLLDQGRKGWVGASFHAVTNGKSGPMPDFMAKQALLDRAEAVRTDRMQLNEGGFFDRQGRAMRIDPVD